MLRMLNRFSRVRLFVTLWSSPPGFPVHGILQARRLEWVAVPSSRGSSQPEDWTLVSCVPCISGRFFTHQAMWEALPAPYLDSFFSPHNTLHYLIYYIFTWFFLKHDWLPFLTEHQLQESRGCICLFYLLVYLQSLKSCLCIVDAQIFVGK